MRSIIAIVLGFTLLIGGSAYVTKNIVQTAESLINQLNQAELLIISQKWEEADALSNETYQSWLQAKKWWAVVLNHSTLSAIEINFQRLEQFENNHELSLSLAELNTLLILLKEIPQSEDLSINNIL